MAQWLAQDSYKVKVVGSSPVIRTKWIYSSDALERNTDNVEVGGSSPPISTKNEEAQVLVKPNPLGGVA